MIANVVISAIDVLMYVVLSKAEKCMPYGELVDTTECIMLHPKCCCNQGSYNWVQLYYFLDFMIMNFANSQISGQDPNPDQRYISHTGFCSCGTFRSQYVYLKSMKSVVLWSVCCSSQTRNKPVWNVFCCTLGEIMVSYCFLCLYSILFFSSICPHSWL